MQVHQILKTKKDMAVVTVPVGQMIQGGGENFSGAAYRNGRGLG